MIAGFSTQVIAQQSKVVSAYNYLNMYLKDKDIDQLKKAQENIDEAILNDKTMLKPKTWYYRGNVYWSMSESKDPAFLEGGANHMLTAIESYKKAYDLEPGYENGEESYQKALIGYKNLGIISFNKNDFEGALNYFEKSYEMGLLKGVTDTSSVENSSIAAIRGKNYEKADKYLRQMIGYKMDKDGARYLQLVRIQADKGDTVTSMKTLAEGREVFPGDQNLLKAELNYYLQRGNSAEAEKLLVLAIEKDPTNHLLHYAAGTIYEDLGNHENAIAAYKKSIELKPDFWEAYFNMGALYNNKAGIMLREMEDRKEKNTTIIDETTIRADAELKKALPLLEKALELAPAESPDLPALYKSLKSIYAKLSMMEKYDEVNKLLKP
jgi:tetratricopeptide (TPR) repeat protein